MGTLYDWVKIIHILSIITWMAGLFYLPRLFVYHTQVAPGSEASDKFVLMEHRLLKYIMNPSIVAAWVFGLWLTVLIPDFWTQGWLHVKLLCVLLMSGFHGMCAAWRKKFAAGANQKSEKYYRVANEVPTILLIVIVVMVIIKPF